MRASLTRLRPLLPWLAAVAMFLLAWVLRYNDPEGSFGGLTDDHMFYAVQGWQLLYGELPDRDFNDPGAPLTYVVSWLLQLALGRSVWSEYVFCVLVLSLGVGLTCVLAARATGSVLLGLGAALLEIALRPRLYNWPKILVYAVGIAVIWHWLSAPRSRRTWLVAGVTAVAFLLRHDHGLYLAGAFGLALLAASELRWSDRLRQGTIFALALLLCLSPYLVFLQLNGGVVQHVAAGARYSARDYDRSPLNPPRPVFASLFRDDGGDESAWWERSPFAALDEHYSRWWLYWALLLIPLASLALLALQRGERPPPWRQERVKIAVVALLTLVLHYRLVRGNVDGRFGDIAVPIAILAAWTLRAAFRPPWRRALVLGTAALVIVLATAAVLTRPTGELVRNSALLDGADAVSRDAAIVTRQLQQTWPLEYWTEDTSGQIGLARYLNACTAPGDRVLMTAFFPPVYGLAQRGFAGGRLDLRGGFYDTPAEQEVTVQRLRRQSVPVVIGPPSSGRETFTREFPIVADYLYGEYESAGDRDIGGGLSFALLVRRGLAPAGVYEPLGLPCFQ
ncbi:MAG: hypothetical protein AB7P99_01415 [Vicinamibacterales bacterium]